MRSLLSAALATAVALVLAPSVHADDLVVESLVLDVTTKLGVEKTISVAKIEAGGRHRLGFGIPNLLPERVRKSAEQFLVLTSSIDNDPFATRSKMIAVIPWQSIKEFSFERGMHTVTTLSGAKFKGIILTRVATRDDKSYPLADCTKIAVKKATKFEAEDYQGPTAKCTVEFQHCASSFEAKRVGFYRGGGGRGLRGEEPRLDPFHMKVSDETVSANLSDFEKITFQGSPFKNGFSAAMRFAVETKAPKGQATQGELVGEGGRGGGHQMLVLDVTNDYCTVVLDLGAVVGAPIDSTFRVTIASTTAGERLPVELKASGIRKQSKPPAEAKPHATTSPEVRKLASQLVEAPPNKQEELLKKLKDAKGTDNTLALAEAIRQLKGPTKTNAREALAERLSNMKASTLLAYMQDEDPELRRAAALAAAMKEDSTFVGKLIDLLNDPEKTVARAAHAALKDLTKQDFGPAADASEGQKADAIKAWKAWWKKQGAK